MEKVRQRYQEDVPVERLRPHPLNANEGARAVIAESIEENGWYGAVIAHEETGYIVAGNHRWEEACKKGAETIPVIWLDVDEKRAGKILAVDNRSGRLGRDDDAKLAELLESFAGDFAGTGYGMEDLDALLWELGDGSRPRQGEPDEVPEVETAEERWVTQPGDLWLIGDHRVLHGDATVREDIDRVLDGEHLAGAIVMDPPYGVGIGAKNRALDAIDRAGQVLTDMEGDDGIEEVEKLWRDSFAVLYDVMPGGCPYYIFGPQGGDLGLLLLLLRDSGLAPRHILIWVKNRASFSIGRLDYDYQHEPIVYGWRPGGGHPWHAKETQTSVLAYDRPQASPEHATVKPVDLLTRLITNSTMSEQLVLDPFGGSGSTLIAAHGVGRRARLVEKDRRFVDVICRRAQRVYGLVPILERTGEAHDFTA